MTLLHSTGTSPLDEVYVALDVETTGLDSARDVIIEIGAVKFRGTEVLETFETLVNPRRTLAEFITNLTGITQEEVDGAPLMAEVAERFMEFLGEHPLLGHSVGFDLGFLARAGFNLTNPSYDTHDLATVLLPQASEYSLSGLARALDVSHERPHRALEDSHMCQGVFLALVNRGLETDPGLLEAMTAIAGRSPWPLRGLLAQLAAATRGSPSTTGVVGLDLESLKKRMKGPKPLRLAEGLKAKDGDEEEEEVRLLLEEGGDLSQALPGYEYRPQQAQMAQAVTRALNDGHHLMVEAGTGVGKSVAYLLPAILFAVRNGTRVVVSTNTINLQEQLMGKDIPALVEALKRDPAKPAGRFQFTQLKGRSNYLCLRRWTRMVQNGNISPEDARMACKALVWMQDTTTGDRSEINIPRRDGYLWDRISAVVSAGCDAPGSACFLRTARIRAEGAHVVVVNHSLLLSDLASGGSVIPQYDHLIVDEAHHLEEEASRQFGYEVPWQTVEELANLLVINAQATRNTIRIVTKETSRQERVGDVVGEMEVGARRLGESWNRLASTVSAFTGHHMERSETGRQLRIISSSRKQPDWSDIEVGWEDFNEALVSLSRHVERLLLALEGIESVPLEDVRVELKGWQERADEARRRVEDFIIRPDDDYVYWVTLSGQDGAPTLNAAPLDVAPKLEQLLFSQKRSVVLTSATLSVEGSMQFMSERTGLTDAEELIVGSPFDYEKSALVLVSSDIPNPTEGGYQQAIEDALIRTAKASRGGVLALFTSHAAVQTTRRRVKPVLESEGISVLAQGIDGPPQQLMAAAAKGNAVLLGTSSFWEGVDLPGDLLRVVVVARLPFSVPTDPVFAARSERFKNSFYQYAVPQAALRFRQGFGRLIRTKTDRGVVVVLDSRIASKPYGKVFLESLPGSTVRKVGMGELGPEVAGWLGA